MLRHSGEMTEAEVVYADVTFTKSQEKKPGKTPSPGETIYAEVNIKQPSDPQKLDSSAGGSKITTERVALVILSLLLTTAVIALIYISLDSVQIKESLHHLNDANTHLTERYEKLKETLDKQICPAGVNTTEPCPPCPEDWEGHGDQCYYFNENAMTWELARAQCQQRGADLVRVDSEDEQTFLTEKLNSLMKELEDKFWIGLTDAQTEGTWLWVDGSPLNESLEFWYRDHEPDNWDGENYIDGEDCARMGERSYRNIIIQNWFDRDCNAHHKSICEKAAVRGHYLFCV